MSFWPIQACTIPPITLLWFAAHNGDAVKGESVVGGVAVFVGHPPLWDLPPQWCPQYYPCNNQPKHGSNSGGSGGHCERQIQGEQAKFFSYLAEVHSVAQVLALRSRHRTLRPCCCSRCRSQTLQPHRRTCEYGRPRPRQLSPTRGWLVEAQRRISSCYLALVFLLQWFNYPQTMRGGFFFFRSPNCFLRMAIDSKVLYALFQENVSIKWMVWLNSVFTWPNLWDP